MGVLDYVTIETDYASCEIEAEEEFQTKCLEPGGCRFRIDPEPELLLGGAR